MNDKTKRRAKIINRDVRARIKSSGEKFETALKQILEDGKVILQDSRERRGNGHSFYTYRSI